MDEIWIVSASRTAIGRATRGALRYTRPDDLAAIAIKSAVERAVGIDPAEIGDVVLGCAMPEQEQGMNLARIALLRAGLPSSVPGVTINRFCSSGLEAIAIGAQRIASGQTDVVIAGGVESMSMVPFDKTPIKPNPHLMCDCPDAYLAMGLTGENLASGWGVSREEADDFSYQSHQKALSAIEKGNFRNEIVPVQVQFQQMDAKGKITTSTSIFITDECPRQETSLEALAALKPAFQLKGTVTAGNSSQRSDGAAAVVLMSPAKAKSLGLSPLGKFLNYTVVGVPPEIMGIGPAHAIPALLAQSGIKISDISVVELNEAFAAQALAVIKEYPIPAEKINPNGGAVALGHPLGCTGARQTVTLLNELKRRGGGYGIVSMCIGGGMGAAGLFVV